MSEKTEEPTAKRLRDARERGEAALSRDAVTAASLLGLMLSASLTAERVREAFSALYSSSLQAVSTRDVPPLSAVLSQALSLCLGASLPVLGASCLLAVFTSALQTRFLIAPQAALPKFDKLNVVGALARYAKPRTYVEPLLHLLRGLIVLWAGLSLLWTLFFKGALRASSPPSSRCPWISPKPDTTSISSSAPIWWTRPIV